LARFSKAKRCGMCGISRQRTVALNAEFITDAVLL
jgi:hypothetical protein